MILTIYNLDGVINRQTSLGTILCETSANPQFADHFLLGTP